MVPSIVDVENSVMLGPVPRTDDNVTTRGAPVDFDTSSNENDSHALGYIFAAKLLCSFDANGVNDHDHDKNDNENDDDGDDDEGDDDSDDKDVTAVVIM